MINAQDKLNIQSSGKFKELFESCVKYLDYATSIKELYLIAMIKDSFGDWSVAHASSQQYGKFTVQCETLSGNKCNVL